MRDIVSIHGTLRSGLGLPTQNASINGSAVSLVGYNGCMIYILAGTWTDGTHAFTIQVAPDNNGSPGSWSSAPTSDLVAWTATSSSVYTPVKVGGSQPASISSSATAINQRIGYIGGVAGTSDWLRIITAVSGATTGAQYDVIIALGLPRVQPSAV